MLATRENLFFSQASLWFRTRTCRWGPTPEPLAWPELRRVQYSVRPDAVACCCLPPPLSCVIFCPSAQAAQHHERTGEGSTQVAGSTVPARAYEYEYCTQAGPTLPLSINPCINPSTSRTRYGTRTVLVQSLLAAQHQSGLAYCSRPAWPGTCPARPGSRRLIEL